MKGTKAGMMAAAVGLVKGYGGGGGGLREGRPPRLRRTPLPHRTAPHSPSPPSPAVTAGPFACRPPAPHRCTPRRLHSAGPARGSAHPGPSAQPVLVRPGPADFLDWASRAGWAGAAVCGAATRVRWARDPDSDRRREQPVLPVPGVVGFDKVPLPSPPLLPPSDLPLSPASSPPRLEFFRPSPPTYMPGRLPGRLPPD